MTSIKNLSRRWLGFTIVGMVIWVLVADVYWVSKERALYDCITQGLINFALKHRVNPEIVEIDRAGTWASEYIESSCSYLHGRGNEWNSKEAMSFVEIIILIPVIYRIDW